MATRQAPGKVYFSVVIIDILDISAGLSRLYGWPHHRRITCCAPASAVMRSAASCSRLIEAP